MQTKTLVTILIVMNKNVREVSNLKLKELGFKFK